MANIDHKVLQYENFINEILRRDLQLFYRIWGVLLFGLQLQIQKDEQKLLVTKVLEQRDSVYEKISQYLQLKNTLQNLQEDKFENIKTEVDLGCNFYVQAQVEDASRVFVAVGYGFFVEMTHEEALRFIEKKTAQLTQFTEQLTKDSAKIKAHICLVLEGLRELQGFCDLPESGARDIL